MTFLENSNVSEVDLTSDSEDEIENYVTTKIKNEIFKILKLPTPQKTKRLSPSEKRIGKENIFRHQMLGGLILIIDQSTQKHNIFFNKSFCKQTSTLLQNYLKNINRTPGVLFIIFSNYNFLLHNVPLRASLTQHNVGEWFFLPSICFASRRIKLSMHLYKIKFL